MSSANTEVRTRVRSSYNQPTYPSVSTGIHLTLKKLCFGGETRGFFLVGRGSSLTGCFPPCEDFTVADGENPVDARLDGCHPCFGIKGSGMLTVGIGKGGVVARGWSLRNISGGSRWE